MKSGVWGLVARGVLHAGDQVPAIRVMAETLLVNPNTIARAYRELMMEGFLESRRGEGNYIANTAKRAANNGVEAERLQFMEPVRRAPHAGVSGKELQARVPL